MDPKQIDALWNEYENKYCAAVSESLIDSITYGYARLCKWFKPEIDADKLSKELHDNFIISAEIKKQIGFLGRIIQTPLLAAANIGTITAKHVGTSTSANLDTTCADLDTTCADLESSHK